MKHGEPRTKNVMQIVYWMLENGLSYKEAIKEHNKILKGYKEPFFTPTEEDKNWILEEVRLTEEKWEAQNLAEQLAQ